jgi:hypothetical protein
MLLEANASIPECLVNGAQDVLHLLELLVFRQIGPFEAVHFLEKLLFFVLVA